MVPINYVSEIKMFIYVTLLNVFTLYVYPSVAGEENTRVTNFPPAGLIHFINHSNRLLVTIIMDTPLYCSNECSRLVFPECATIFKTSSFPRQIFVCNAYAFYFSSHIIAVKVLFCTGDPVLGFRRVEFFLQVSKTDFYSFGGGKYKVVRSLVSKKSHENYSFVTSDG